MEEDGSTGQLINFSVIVMVNFCASSFFVELCAQLDALRDDTFELLFLSYSIRKAETTFSSRSSSMEVAYWLIANEPVPFPMQCSSV